MTLSLRQLHIPYLKTGHSGIWGRDLQYNPGEQVHLRARSGQGKTTLIQTLYGLQKNYSGDILFDGKALRSLSTEQICHVRQQQVSIVFQNLRLFEDQSARDNLEVKRALTNYYPTERIDQFAQRLGVALLLERRTDTLSYGERQRIAIIRALLQPFQLLLMDEPFSHLDEENIRLAAALIAEEVAQRKATLFLADLEDDDRFSYTQKINL